MASSESTSGNVSFGTPGASPWIIAAIIAGVVAVVWIFNRK